MSNEEIKKIIDSNNDKIAEMLDLTVFTLNPQISALLESNKKLQQQCKHQFSEGVCLYCYKEE